MPHYDGKEVAQDALLNVAKHIAQATLNTPQITGQLDIKIEILTGEDLKEFFYVEDEMHKVGAVTTAELMKVAYDRGEPPVMMMIGADCTPMQKAPCKGTCPAGLDVPRQNRLIKDGSYAEALAVMRESVPLPSVIGRICRAPCQMRCKRNERMDEENIAIRELHRFITEKTGSASTGEPQVAEATGKRVAVVGSGPAGLTVAYFLAKVCGHAVTVFEALPEAGGMMRVGIPEYRLPKALLDADIEAIKAVGVDIRTGARIESLDALLGEGYDAILLAIGAQKGMKLGIKGEDSAQVIDGVTFLKDVNLGKDVKLGDRVAVIGGGNVAIHAARTALHIGAKEVTIIYRGVQAQMPATGADVGEALKEGVKAEFLAVPTSVMDENGVIKLECTRLQPGGESVAGSEFTVEVDSVIVAVGEVTEIPGQFGLAVTEQGSLATDPETLATGKAKVFACGDGVSGPSSVIQAIAVGKQAAISIDKYLGGSGNIDDVIGSPFDGDQRLVGFFTGVEPGLDEERARAEARRCLKCDEVGWDCGACGHRTCRGAIAYQRAQERKARLAGEPKGYPGSVGGTWRGPSCIWKSLEFGIACEWACAIAHLYHVPNRPQMGPGGIIMRMGYLEGCSLAITLPLGPCRESWYMYNPGTGLGGMMYDYEATMRRQIASSPNLFMRALAPGALGAGVKIKDNWWEPPYATIQVTEHPELDEFAAVRAKTIFDALQGARKRREAKKAGERGQANPEFSWVNTG